MSGQIAIKQFLKNNIRKIVTQSSKSMWTGKYTKENDRIETDEEVLSRVNKFISDGGFTVINIETLVSGGDTTNYDRVYKTSFSNVDGFRVFYRA